VSARPRRAAAAALVAFAVTVLGTTGVAFAHAKSSPTVQTQAPTAVRTASAVLHGLVDPGSQKTTYWFELGTTTAFGTSTNPASTGNGDEAVSVSHGIGNLQPATTYHVHVVASNEDGVAPGDDVTFTTPATAQDGGAALPTPAAPSPLPGTELGPAPAAPPALERSVAIAPANGSVLVRVPGATHAAALSDSASVPLGSVIDTRAGSVTLKTALPGGHTQTGTFHGGLFEVRQPTGGHGMTELVLRGAPPTCPTGGARAAAITRKRPPRVLWGHDRHGRFRTRASNSVITVRGTTWYVADRCDGTLTRVTSGSVSVRDLRRQRTVVVRAGHSYLARRTG
jgi:hypothetical protein